MYGFTKIILAAAALTASTAASATLITIDVSALSEYDDATISEHVSFDYNGDVFNQSRKTDSQEVYANSLAFHSGYVKVDDSLDYTYGSIKPELYTLTGSSDYLAAGHDQTNVGTEPYYYVTEVFGGGNFFVGLSIADSAFSGAVPLYLDSGSVSTGVFSDIGGANAGAIGSGFACRPDLNSPCNNFGNDLLLVYGFKLTVGDPAAAAVPEPATWAMLIGGFGIIGGAMRRRKVAVSFA